MRFKVYEPLLVIGLDKFANVDIRVRVSGGGQTSQVYAVRQAISKVNAMLPVLVMAFDFRR